MSRARLAASIALGSFLGWNVTLGNAVSPETTRTSQESVQVIAHRTTLSQSEATLQFQFLNGEAITVALAGGQVTTEWMVGDSLSRREVAEYERGGRLEAAWKRTIAAAGRLNSREALALIQDWRVDDLATSDAAAYEVVSSQFANLVAATGLDAVAAGDSQGSGDRQVDETGAVALVSGELEALQALEALKALERLEDLEGVEGLAALEELEDLEGLEKALAGLATLQRLGVLEQIEPVTPETVASETRPTSMRSITGEIVSDIVGLFATFVALSALGFGLVFFAPRQLEIVADTVHHSFWRSFMIGLFAQPLIVPAFGMLLLGLALTVVGIVIIPFAAAGFLIAIALAITGGYLAVARSVGEAYLRVRMSRGYAVGSWLSYRYIVYGLVALLAVWLPVALLGQIPVAGDIALIAAVALTWMVTTAGFGATLLSRAGIRGTFAHRFDAALSDEYLFQTPQATPIVRKHERFSGD